MEWGKKEIVELSKPSSACSRKKEEPVDFVLMRPILPLAITVTHMSLTCQYGNYTSSRIIFFCLNASASMTFIHPLLLFITHLSTVSDLTMGSIKTNSTGSPAFFLPHSMLGSLLLLIFFFAPLGSLFTGYHGDLFPFTTCSFSLINNRAELQTPVIIIIFYFLTINLLFLFSSLVELSY